MSPESGMPIPQDLLDILVCPVCKKSLTLGPERTSLQCAECRLAYPIRDGIPTLLSDQATPIEGHERK